MRQGDRGLRPSGEITEIMKSEAAALVDDIVTQNTEAMAAEIRQKIEQAIAEHFPEDQRGSYLFLANHYFETYYHTVDNKPQKGPYVRKAKDKK